MEKSDEKLKTVEQDIQNAETKDPKDKKQLKHFLSHKLEILNNPTETEVDTQKTGTTKVFVSNIPKMVPEKILIKFFSKFGPIIKATIIRNEIDSGGYILESTGKGIIKFKNKADAVKVLKAGPKELMLKDEVMVCQKFCKKKTNETRIKGPILETRDDKEEKREENSLINDLPTDVLANIFGKLCLRDLCISERICKHWYDISKLVWSFKKELILNDHNLFGGYKNEQKFGFSKSPNFDEKGLKQILKKSFSKKLRYLDLSEVRDLNKKGILKFIVDHCPDLEHLNISNMSASNLCMREICGLNKLKVLKFAECSGITDSTVSKIFYNCKKIESVGMTNCRLLTGECLSNAPYSLKSLVIDCCGQIRSKSLQDLFEKNKDFEEFSAKKIFHEFYFSLDHVFFLLNDCHSLKSLNISDISMQHQKLSEINNFKHLKNFERFELTSCAYDGNFIKNLLETSSTLKYLILPYSRSDMTNNVEFLSKNMKAPLVELNVDRSEINDEALMNLASQLCGTLKKLNVSGCNNLTNSGITESIIQLTKLTSINVRSVNNVENSLLESVINLENNRPIRIDCIGTNVNSAEFEIKYPETEKTLINYSEFEFKYKNLTFVSNLTGRSGGVKVWKENGLMYIGSDSDSEDLDDLDDLNDANLGENPNIFYGDDNEGHDRDDLYFDEDNEVPEMFDEMGQFNDDNDVYDNSDNYDNDDDDGEFDG